MCLVAQVVGAPVQCSEGCEQHNLAISLSVHEMTPRNGQKINHISPNIFIFLISCPPTKNVIQNFESPKMDRTYLYMIISVCHNPPPPPAKKLTSVLEQYAAKYSSLSACFLSQSINQSVSQPIESTASIFSSPEPKAHW